LDIDIKLPRRTGHQVYRENHEASFPEEFYRRTIYIPHLENMIHQMEVRFLPTEQLCLKLQYSIPAFVKRGSFVAVQDTLDMYSCDVDSSLSVLKAEYDRLMIKWSSVPNSKLPANILETLAVCEPFSFPNVHTLLHLFATLPVTTATTERSFPTLRRLPEYLRSNMGLDRLNGLAHLTINRDVTVDPEIVSDELSEKKRRLNFIF